MNPEIAVIQFPGSNCDQDCVIALNDLGARAQLVWHKEASVENFDAVVVPGGFSYGDYLRCGAIAQFSPVMQSVKALAGSGLPVLGICNGFQILCECGLLPGALVRNRSLHFVCDYVYLRVESGRSPVTNEAMQDEVLSIPVAHGEGNYVADQEILRELDANGQVILRYCMADGVINSVANPNGSIDNIAGVCNVSGNVIGMMPHPERAYEPRLGSSDGRKLLELFIENCKSSERVA